MVTCDCVTIFLTLIFSLGYLGIIFEHPLRINKSAIALITGACLWALFFLNPATILEKGLNSLGHHISDIAQIVFFLLGAMTLVELVDSHKGFSLITNRIHTKSKRSLLWIIASVAFILSGILDNLTTTILMVSLLKKIIPSQEERVLYSCIIVVAANAGGAWTPIGDVTTTMLWIQGQISSLAIMKALFIPSLISMVVPLLYYTLRLKGTIATSSREKETPEPSARLVLYLGLGGLMFVPIFKFATGLPPFMGILLALGILWFVTDRLHSRDTKRQHLQVPSILHKIDSASLLFFLGILLSVDALESAHLLQDLASWISSHIKNLPLIATSIGLFSAVIDNVPLVAGTMNMYSLTQFPQDHTFWHMIAYAAGTGGSLLIIGSSAGVAMMGMEKIDFISYVKKATFPTLLGFLAGMGVYIFI